MQYYKYQKGVTDVHTTDPPPIQQKHLHCWDCGINRNADPCFKTLLLPPSA